MRCVISVVQLETTIKNDMEVKKSNSNVIKKHNLIVQKYMY